MPRKTKYKYRRSNKKRHTGRNVRIAIVAVMAFFTPFLVHYLPAFPVPLARLPAPVATYRPLMAPAASPGPVLFPVPTPTPPAYFSPFTGLAASPENLALRPVAVVFDNNRNALPQSGLSQAAIIYEVLAEGHTTRLIGIFEAPFMAEAVGPVRSARDYFAEIALNHDAVFVHHGGSPSGYARLRNLGLDTLDGMRWEGIAFWRDPERWRTPRLREHSSFTSGPAISQAMEQQGFRTGRRPDTGFAFHDTPHSGTIHAFAAMHGGEVTTASAFVVPFSPPYTRRFVYDPARDAFVAYHPNGPHMDAITNQPLAVQNVLVKRLPLRIVDNEGRRAAETVGSGAGYWAAHGHIMEVTWQREALTTPTRWFFADGTPLTLSPGTTWVCWLQNTTNIQTITEEIHEQQL